MEEDEENQATQVFEKREKLLKGAAGAMRRDMGGDIEEHLTVDFCKKFIHYAKLSYEPKLTDMAAEAIAECYAELRDPESADEIKSLPITARCLECIIRLSTAHAKLRLSR